MRPLRLRFRGIGRFGAETGIDFEALGDGLIALDGINGAGKTTAIETLPALLWKRWPSRPHGSIYTMAHGTDAFISASLENDGDAIEAMLRIDAEAKKSEATITVNGESLARHSREYAAEVEKLFGPVSVFLASAFQSQTKAGNFLAMPKAERKAFFVRLLGIGHLSALAARAKEKQAAEELKRTGLDGRIMELGKSGDEARELRQVIERLTDDVISSEEALTLAAGMEEDARASIERAREHERRRKELEARLATAKETARAAVEKADAAGREVERAATADARKKEAEERHAALRAEAEKRLGTLRRQAEEVRDIAAEKAVKEEEEASLAKVIAHIATHEGEAARSRSFAEARERTGAEANASREERRGELVKRSGLIAEVPCGSSASWIREAEKDGDSLRFDLRGTCGLLADARTATEELGRIREGTDSAAAKIAEIEAEAEEFRAAEKAATAAAEKLAEAHPDAAARAETLASAIAYYAKRLAGLPKDPETMIADAEARIEEAQAAHTILVAGLDADASMLAERKEAKLAAVDDATDAMDARDALAAELDDLDAERCSCLRARPLHDPNDPDCPLTQTPETLRPLLHQREAEVRRITTSLGAVKEDRAEKLGAIKKLEEAAEELAVITRSRDNAERERGLWEMLAKALGPDGVQALEIDAAGPEVSAITNELLDSCYGSRFSISLETLKDSADGKRSLEAFDVAVYDDGTRRVIEDLSGGEKVIVGEAINLALAILNARRSGVRWEILFRDETAGALDPENAHRYIEMLRRARELGGFRQVVYVAHLPEVVAGADVILRFRDGAIAADRDTVAA